MIQPIKTKPIFIIGNPRSGTTLLRLLLTCHSKIVIPPECGFIIWLEKKYQDWTLTDCNDPTHTHSFVTDLIACRKFDTWKLDPETIQTAISKRKPANYRSLCELIYCLYGEERKKFFSMWGDKNNFYLNHLSDINTIFPYARFLHIIRDGRDVACSYREVMNLNSKSAYAPQLPTEIEKIALEWKTNIKKINHFFNVVGHKKTLAIKYEELVFSPKKALKKICRWLGIKYENQMMLFHLENHRNKLEPPVTSDWKKRTFEPISTSRVGQYINILNMQEQRQFIKIAGCELSKFGYMKTI
jgi:hypothetical protein